MVEYLRRVRAGYNVAAAAAAAAAAAKRSPNGSPHLKPNPCASQDLARLFATAYAAALPLDHPSVSPLHAGKEYTQRPSEQRPSVPSALWLWAPSLSNGSGRRGKSANGNGRPAPVYRPPGADLAPAHGGPPGCRGALRLFERCGAALASLSDAPKPTGLTRYVVPSRHADLRGLPPLCIESGGCEVRA